MDRGATFAIRALHVAVLSAFAVSQPLFDLLARHPTFLIAHELDALDLALLAALLGLALPAALGAAAAGLAALAGRAGGALHLAAVALAAAAVALPPLSRAGVAPGALALALAAALGALAALAHARARAVRRIATALAAAVPLFPALFLARSEIAPLLAPDPAFEGLGVRFERPAPVVMVVFDALSLYALVDGSGEIDARRYPSFAALAREAHWFRNATTVAEKTKAALPAILTGRYPTRDLRPTAAEYPQSLFSAFAGQYRVFALEPITQLCPQRLCAPLEPRAARLAGLASDLRLLLLHVLLPPDLARSLPAVDQTWRDFADGEARERRGGRHEVRERGMADAEWLFERFLADLPPGGDRPGLHFLHLHVPHWPYRYLPSGRTYGGFGRHVAEQYGDPTRWSDPDWTEAVALQPYLLQVGYADALLGRLRAHLERTGLYDRALLIVTSDHGVSFRPGRQARLVDERNAGDLLPVPLFVKLPGQRAGSRSERNAETIDILPTAVAALGGRLREPVDGVPLLDAAVPERSGKQVFAHRAGGTLRFAYGHEIPERFETARRIEAAFDLARPDGLFALGPRRDWLGRELGSLPAQPAAGLRIRLSHAFAYQDVDPEAHFVPAFVAGSLEARDLPAGPLELVVAVNGVVRALARSFAHEEGTARFEALVPETSFRAGPNQVEVRVVAQGPQGPVLLAAQERPERGYRVARAFDGSAGAVVSSEGRVYAVVPGAVGGELERRGFSFAGRSDAEEVLLFAGGRFLLARELSGDPPGREPREFTLAAPYASPSELAGASARFLGLAAGLASEFGPRSSEPWPTEGAELRLERREGREGLAAGGAGWVQLPEAPGARLEWIALSGERAELGGRAAPGARGEAPVALLLFADGRFAASAPLAAGEPGAPDAPGGGAGWPFRASLPRAALEGAAGIRLFGVSPAGRLAEIEAGEAWARRSGG
jgi:hypothetical protein